MEYKTEKIGRAFSVPTGYHVSKVEIGHLTHYNMETGKEETRQYLDIWVAPLPEGQSTS
jgi:hypothetical protein